MSKFLIYIFLNILIFCILTVKNKENNNEMNFEGFYVD